VKGRRVFLARHGNREDLVDPSWLEGAAEPYDPPLSLDGIEQARGLGRRLAGEGIRAIVASPFLRTVQTAEHIAREIGAPVFLEPGFGEWLARDSFERSPQLRSFEELRAAHPALDPDYTPCATLRWPETRQELLARVGQTLTCCLARLDGTLLVVGHAASVAAAALLDPQVTRVECPLCALFCLEHDGRGWHLVINAEVAHLAAALATFVFP
jgi:broad specificity phosphatase PhoE